MAFSSYRLSPEHPFPASLMDVMASISYMLEAFLRRRVTILGFSAGGHVALAASMEAISRFPGRIASLLLQAPILLIPNPTILILSRPMDATTFLRWGWRAFLEMNEKTNKENSGEETLQKSSRDWSSQEVNGSHRALWEASKWSNSQLRRLARPLEDFPATLDAHDAPRIIVVSHRRDPPHDDSIALVEALKDANAKVQHIDGGGMHCSSTIDPTKNGYVE